MRYTFGQLIQISEDFCIDATTSNSSGLSSTQVFLKRELNNASKDLFTLLKKYSLQPPAMTFSTVASQIYYHYPPGFSKLESITVPVGSMAIPLRIVQSQSEWDALHIVAITSNYPEAVFPRRDDFGIYPTPSSAVTCTMVGNYQPKNMTAQDVVSGTVTATNNSVTITGNGTLFTVAMVGLYFMLTDSSGISLGSWYRISGVASSTSLTLETYFQESTVTSASYVIADSPAIPEELQEFLPYRAAAVYYANRRRDLDQAQRFINFYYTGDFSNTKRSGTIRGGVLAVLKDLQENGRGNSQITEMAGGRSVQFANPWSALGKATP